MSKNDSGCRTQAGTRWLCCREANYWWCVSAGGMWESMPAMQPPPAATKPPAAISLPGPRLKQVSTLHIISWKCNEGGSSGWWKDNLIIDGYEMNL